MATGHEGDEHRPVAPATPTPLDTLALYRNLFAAVGDAVLVADEQARYIDANPAAVALLGYSRPRLLGMRVPDVVALDAAETEAMYARFTAEGSWRGELHLRRADGTLVPVEGVATAVPQSGGTRYVSVLRDISERCRHERMRAGFLELASHELRTPLTALTGYLDLLRRRGRFDARAVATALRQARHLGLLVADVLETARMDAGHTGLQRAPTDLAALARRAAAEAEGLMEGRAVRVEVGGGRTTGWWDADRVEQVVQNLLANAARYAPEGEVVVRVEGREREAVVAVRDSGPGIPPGALSHLFERFWRGPTATASATKGFGLGLYAAKGVVEAHGGRIWAESVEEEGATFIFTLPYGEPPA